MSLRSIFTDAFTRADGNIGNGWLGNPNSHFQIASNKVTGTTGTYTSGIAIAPTSVLTDGGCSADMVSGAATLGEALIVRRQGTTGNNSGYLAYVSSNLLRLGRIDAGDAQPATTGTYTLKNGGFYRFVLTAIGSTIKVTIALTSNPTFILDTVTFADATYATGYTGIVPLALNSGFAGTVDNFVAYDTVPTLTISPTTMLPSATKSLTITCTSASWLTSAPSFSADVGTINSTVVVSNTVATVSYTAPANSQTITITDATTTGTGTTACAFPVVIIEGNSLATTDYAQFPTYVISSLSRTVDYFNVALSGADFPSQLVTYEEQIAAHYNPAAPRNIVIIAMAQSNSLAAYTVDDIQATFITFVNRAHAHGFLVVVSTEIDRTNVGLPVDWRSKTDDWNGRLKTTLLSYCDKLTDLAAIAVLGPDGVSANTTYFLADKVHMNDTGALIAATAVAADVNSLLSTGGGVWSRSTLNPFNLSPFIL